MLANKPIVVLDWGWLRARKISHLANQYHYLIPEHVISEAVGASNPYGFVDKLRRICQSNAERMFIGKGAGHVLLAENTPGIVIGRNEISYRRIADFDMDSNGFDPRRWRSIVDDSGPTQAIFLRPKTEFEEHRREYAKVFRAASEAKFPGELDKTEWKVLFEFLRQPTAIESFVKQQFPDCLGPDWEKALHVFPDRHAAGRMSRLALWALLRPTKITSDERLRNDWEDLRYAFLASYADEFWTGDKALAEAVRELFPTVLVKYETAG